MSSLSPARRLFASALALLMLLAVSSGAICQTICASRAAMSAAMASPHAHCRDMPVGPAIAAPQACVPVSILASPVSIVSTIVRSDLVMAAAPAWRPGGTTTAANGSSTARMTSPISPPWIGDPPSVLRI
jgi:hypothetical protein